MAYRYSFGTRQGDIDRITLTGGQAVVHKLVRMLGMRRPTPRGKDWGKYG
jgi:hypothetical protein